MQVDHGCGNSSLLHFMAALTVFKIKLKKGEL